MNIIKNKKQSGATMVEYAIMVGLIAIVVFAGVTTLGTRTSSLFQGAVTSYPSTG